MAQLPASLRRKRAAITSIHDKPPTAKEKLIHFGGWVLLCVAVLVLAVGTYGLYKVMTNAQVAKLECSGYTFRCGTPPGDDACEPCNDQELFHL